MRGFILSHMRAANAQRSLHIRTVSSYSLLLELKKEAMQMKFQAQLCPFKVSGSAVLDSFFNVPPI